jgi:PhnB protein
MTKTYKPAAYNSVSPYFVVEGAQRLVDLLRGIFGATQLRRYERPDGTIMHVELRIDDSVIMIGDASEQYPAREQMLHVYVQDVDAVFDRAIEMGCTVIEEPKVREGDPERRGSFSDFAGNHWSVATQEFGSQ